jgi:hypothetical protein
MSSENPISSGSGSASPVPNAPLNGDAVAANYLVTQVQQARVALQRTRIVGLVMLLLLGGEMIYITSKFASSLQPHAAAEIADGMILQQINDRGPELADQLKQKIPEYIQQTPDYALKELPKYRLTLEDRMEAQLKGYCDATTEKLDKQLDTYLTDHKEDIKGMITTGSDPAITKRVGQDLKKQFLTYVQAKGDSGESIQEHLDISLAALQGTAKTMHRLATARDLNGQEKQTRHALAVLTSSLGDVR